VFNDDERSRSGGAKNDEIRPDSDPDVLQNSSGLLGSSRCTTSPGRLQICQRSRRQGRSYEDVCSRPILELMSLSLSKQTTTTTSAALNSSASYMNDRAAHF
jgi:hypothetical protein